MKKHKKNKVFTFRLSEMDRKKLQYIANNTGGCLSTTLRFIITNAYRKLNNKNTIEVGDDN